MDDRLRELYYSWLCDLIGVTKNGNTYWLLISALYERAFYWSVPNDDNRAYEGKNLRERFCEENRMATIVSPFEMAAAEERAAASNSFWGTNYSVEYFL